MGPGARSRHAAGVSPAHVRNLLAHAKADLSVHVYQGREADPAATLARLEAGVASVATGAPEDGEA